MFGRWITTVVDAFRPTIVHHPNGRINVFGGNDSYDTWQSGCHRYINGTDNRKRPGTLNGHRVQKSTIADQLMGHKIRGIFGLPRTLKWGCYFGAPRSGRRGFFGRVGRAPNFRPSTCAPRQLPMGGRHEGGCNVTVWLRRQQCFKQQGGSSRNNKGCSVHDINGGQCRKTCVQCCLKTNVFANQSVAGCHRMCQRRIVVPVQIDGS